MKKIWKMISLLPLLFMLYIIFFFSAQDGNTSGSLSLRICSFLVGISDRLFHLELSPVRMNELAQSLQLLVRKCAHMTEYFILAFTIYLPLHVLLPKQLHLLRFQHPKLLATFFLGVLFAALDEFHQHFVPGRCGTPVDVLIDTIGITVACLFLYLGTRLALRKRISFGG